MSKKRNSNLELLRIISMILIIMHHSIYHGLANVDQYYSINKYIADIIFLVGKIGVNIFILISGYFLITSHFTLRAALRFLGQVWFYSIGIMLILTMTGVTKFTDYDIVHSLLPISFNMNWFATVYFVMVLFSPYMNRLAKCITQKQYQILLVTMFTIWCIPSTIGAVIPLLSGMSYSLIDFTWFVFLYFLSGYIRLYINFSEKSIFKYRMSLIFWSMLLIFISGVSNFLWHHLNSSYFFNETRSFWLGNNIFSLMISVEALLYFASKPPKYNRFINYIAKASFGVYLIHDNSYIRPLLWDKIFVVSQHYDSQLFILWVLGGAIVIYTICSIIDILRFEIFERIWMKIVDSFLMNALLTSGKLIEKLMFKIAKIFI